jgi:hypothetical protein
MDGGLVGTEWRLVQQNCFSGLFESKMSLYGPFLGIRKRDHLAVFGWVWKDLIWCFRIYEVVDLVQLIVVVAISLH